MEIIRDEMLAKDIEILDKRVEDLQYKVKKNKDLEAEKEV